MRWRLRPNESFFFKLDYLLRHSLVHLVDLQKLMNTAHYNPLVNSIESILKGFEVSSVCAYSIFRQ